jgi:uncharacterized protein YcbK (DUF882 family)
MITLDELLSGNDFDDQSPAIQSNIQELLVKVNKIRAAYNRPMFVTSGLRSLEHHLEIYAKKGITDRARIPMKSRHLSGQACDVSDPNKELQKFILSNVKLLEDSGLYCESFVFTTSWVHFQEVPPLSGRRFFMP